MARPAGCARLVVRADVRAVHRRSRVRREHRRTGQQWGRSLSALVGRPAKCATFHHGADVLLAARTGGRFHGGHPQGPGARARARLVSHRRVRLTAPFASVAPVAARCGRRGREAPIVALVHGSRRERPLTRSRRGGRWARRLHGRIWARRLLAWQRSRQTTSGANPTFDFVGQP